MNDEEKAEKKSNEAKILYDIQQYSNALHHYSEAIRLCPTNYKYWGNRSACYLMLKKYNEALRDAKKSVDLNDKYVRGYIRIAKCFKNLDELRLADEYLKSNRDVILNDSIQDELDEIKNLMDYDIKMIENFKKKNYEEALVYVQKYLSKIPESKKYVLYKAECLYLLRKGAEFEKITNEFKGYFLNPNSITDDVIKDFKCLNLNKQIILSDPNRIDAESKNNQGNTYFKLKQYSTALHFYTTAIEKFPSDVKYWGNRAACHIMLKNYSAAMVDAYKSIEIDEKFTKGYLRIAKCKKHFNDLISAKSALHNALLITPNDNTIKKEIQEIESLIQLETDIKNNLEDNEYEKAVKYIDKYLVIHPYNSEYKFKKAKCCIKLHNYIDANKIVSELSTQKPNDENVLYLEAEIHYYKDDIRQSFNHLKDIKRKIPDNCEMSVLFKNAKSILDYINKSSTSTRPEEKYNLLTEAIKIDINNKVTNKNLYIQKFKYALKYSIYSEKILEECCYYLHVYGKSLLALKTRANCYMHLKDYEGARDDYEIILERENTIENKKLFNNADKLFKNETKDNYKILGITTKSTKAEIKRAYLDMSKKYHTDKQNNVTQEIKDRLNKKFIRIKKAYDELKFK